MPVTLLPLLLACSADRTDDLELTTALADAIPTVVLVSWPASDGATAAQVDYGPTEALGWTAPAHLDDGTFRATLVGMKPDSTVSLQALETGEDAATSEMVAVDNGSLSSGLPSVSLSVDEAGRPADGLLLTTIVTNPAAAVMIDMDGDIVWWAEHEGIDQLGRARLGRDGDSVLTMGINAHDEGANSLQRVGLDGEIRETLDVGDSHHDFLELEDGSLVWLTHDSRDVDGESVLGDALTLRDPDGTTQSLWSIWDWRDYDPDEGLNSPGGGDGPGPGGGGGATWTHLNSLVFDGDAFYVGSLGLSALMKIDADSGELLWTFGSSTSDFIDGDGGTEFLSMQHQFQLLDGGLLVFENGTSQRGASRAVEFSFDESNEVVEEVWSYSPDPDIFTFSLGNPIRFDDGSTLVNFATSGQMDLVAADGTLLWRLSASLGGAFGYAEWVETPYGG